MVRDWQMGVRPGRPPTLTSPHVRNRSFDTLPPRIHRAADGVPSGNSAGGVFSFRKEAWRGADNYRAEGQAVPAAQLPTRIRAPLRTRATLGLLQPRRARTAPKAEMSAQGPSGPGNGYGSAQRINAAQEREAKERAKEERRRLKTARRNERAVRLHAAQPKVGMKGNGVQSSAIAKQRALDPAKPTSRDPGAARAAAVGESAGKDAKWAGEKRPWRERLPARNRGH